MFIYMSKVREIFLKGFYSLFFMRDPREIKFIFVYFYTMHLENIMFPLVPLLYLLYLLPESL